MGRTSALALFLVLMLAACGGGSAATAADGGNGDTNATPTAAEETDVATPDDGGGATPDDDGIPSDAELQPRYDRLIAALTPPGGTEEARENPGPLDLGVFFVTTESFDSLVAFYEEAIPAAGLEIVETDDQFPDNRQWIFQSGDMFQGAVGISPAEGGYRASLTMLGIPPEN